MRQSRHTSAHSEPYRALCLDRSQSTVRVNGVDVYSHSIVIHLVLAMRSEVAAYMGNESVGEIIVTTSVHRNDAHLDGRAILGRIRPCAHDLGVVDSDMVATWTQCKVKCNGKVRQYAAELCITLA